MTTKTNIEVTTAPEPSPFFHTGQLVTDILDGSIFIWTERETAVCIYTEDGDYIGESLSNEDTDDLRPWYGTMRVVSKFDEK